ncbi:hypothetical protein CR162_19880 [Pseudoroseomonas rhizosphaerae]|uniref:Methyltransferase FkbM domain-containing protein n=1 Tax=Teichococcus rhizosphaerae TaxID=1335062 RepID=A0A2C7A9C7_9PROT|nr:FkbM family methyltransferase [Pseudoroseomonas rhizosphaerae]PHK93207.1 hypothetical protein CR162_19880 [Pseudoroseomonas rhizosphaerae]
MTETTAPGLALARLPLAQRGRFFDEAIRRLIPRLCPPGGTALDLGAGWGSYTRLMLDSVGPFGRVAAFEPNPEVARGLQDLALRDHRLRVFEQALSNRTGRESFYRLAESGLSSLRERRHLQVPVVDRIAVSVGQLDDCPLVAALPAIDFMRVDVEGEELPLLEGARETIRRTEPIIVLELDWYHLFRSGAGDEHGFFGFLDGLGVCGYEVMDFGSNSVQGYRDDAWNIFLLPRRSRRKAFFQRQLTETCRNALLHLHHEIEL